MTEHDPNVSLCQMRDHAREAMQLAQGKPREEFLADRTANLAASACWRLSARPPAASRRPTVTGTRRFHGRRSLVCATAWPTVTTAWTSISSGRSSRVTFRRSLRN